MKSDISIAQTAKLKDISTVSQQIGLSNEDLYLYGPHKAKITYNAIQSHTYKSAPKKAKLILVTAMSPTPMGEGKTTTTVGLGQAFAAMNKKAIIAIREPSLGPVFGIKGGAAGGGYSQVVPMEDINLHFTGDIHAITTANNLISAALDNHLHQGNELNIDPRQILWSRAMDMNDRSLRNIVIGLGGKPHGVPREDHFNISVASEIMAIFCLARSLPDLQNKIGQIIVATNNRNEPVTVNDLQITGAVTALLKEAFQPNLVQTLENSPALVHGGPFANIAHGCSSLVATELGLNLADYVITEAGFGADLGAEKFFNIKCRLGNLKPDGVVVVATTQSLQYHGSGVLEEGLTNLGKHLENIRQFGLEPIVAINKFAQDTGEDIQTIQDFCSENNVDAAVSEVWAKGGSGGVELAQKVISLTQKPNNFKLLYQNEDTLEEKINKVAVKIYGAESVSFSEQARRKIETFTDWGKEMLPVCIAKTPLSFSDNPKLVGKPEGFSITVRDLNISAGAGFIVALTGDVMTMPGLPKDPAANQIEIDNKGKITGLF